MKQILATASVLALLATPVWAQSNRPASRTAEPATTSQPEHATGKTALNQQDHSFVEKAAEGGLAEVKEAKLAEQKASDPAVQEFGRWMVADHEMANKRLKGIAHREGLTIPSQPNSTQQSQYAQLQKLSGSRFDHQYIQGQVQDHKKVISAFEQEESSGQNRALKAYARQTLPLLRAHLQEAETLSKTMGVASTQPRTEGSGSTMAPARETMNSGAGAGVMTKEQVMTELQHEGYSHIALEPTVMDNAGGSGNTVSPHGGEAHSGTAHTWAGTAEKDGQPVHITVDSAGHVTQQ